MSCSIKLRVIFCSIALCMGVCCAQPVRCQEMPQSKSAPPLQMWSSSEPLPVGSVAWQCAMRSPAGEWAIVKTTDGIQTASPNLLLPLTDTPPFSLPQADGFYGWRRVRNVEDGFLVGTNAGEWGGATWWFSLDGKSHYLILEGNVLDLFLVNRRPFIVSGLNHLGYSIGFVAELYKDHKRRWVVKQKTELQAGPTAFVLDDIGGIVMASPAGLLYYADGIATQLTTSNLIYPNSIEIDRAGAVFVGMRHAVAKFSPGERAGTYVERWLIPPHCTRLIFYGEDTECSCDPGEPDPAHYAIPRAGLMQRYEHEIYILSRAAFLVIFTSIALFLLWRLRR